MQATEVAEALASLHLQDVVHDDLHAVSFQVSQHYYACTDQIQRNVLVDDEGHARLCDYGLSGYVNATVPNSMMGGVADFVAPEKIDLSDVDPTTRPAQTPASDIFAFASLCLQVSTSLLCPYPLCYSDESRCTGAELLSTHMLGLQFTYALLPANGLFAPQLSNARE
jgi:serine/threonine protein kinase